MFQCDGLISSDKYFEGLLGSGLLGDIEPREGELDHLSGLIARELEKPLPDFQGSLSVAVFLVWMGWMHYQEGNFWGPVYGKLGLPPEQVKWQGVLGEGYLQTLEKCRLPEFQGKLRYINPILAHGYVPDRYLESYFKDVVLAIYIDRERAGLQIKRGEAEHLISAWRRDYKGYEECRRKIENLELAESKLVNIFKAWNNEDALLKLQSLQNRLVDNDDLNELLTLPEDWLDKAEEELAACKEQYNFFQDLLERQQEIDESRKIKSTQEAAGYKTKLVKLGRGDLEKGKEVLAEQRELQRKIAQERAQIPGDVNTLLASLSMAGKYPAATNLERRLTSIRKRKKEARERLRIYNNPLYSLNESTRAFIFQGGNQAVEFIYSSLLLIDRLRKGEADRESPLPKRIARAMGYWWEQKGKELFAQAWAERAGAREEEEARADNMRKPGIKFDPVKTEIKAVLPRQPVREPSVARFTAQGESGERQEIEVPVKIEKNSYRSEVAELVLERPEPLYNFKFHCGDTTRSWQINGIGWDRFCMLFNKRGELADNGQLPEDGAYIIAPAGSVVEPVEGVRERLAGYWSNYDYWYVDLENADMVLVRTEKDVSVFKRPPRLQPMFLSRGVLRGIMAGEFIVCQGQLPGLVFSVSYPEEVPFCGIRLDFPGGSVFKPLEELDTAVSKNNVVHVPLTGWPRDKYGLCRVILEKRGTIVWSEGCAVIPGILLRVRTRWQAVKIGLTQRLQDGNRHLLLEWEDRGKAANRVVRLWPLNMSEVDMMEREIADGAGRVEITVPVELLPPGRYRLQLTVADPWSDDIAVLPEQTAENCKDVDIGTKDEQLTKYVGKKLNVVALYHDGQEVKLDAPYWLEVDKLNPTFEEEMRLSGNVYSFTADDTVVEMPYNPVNFYISDNKIPFLIDKDGDGATYCRNCKVLFWEVAHKECGNAVFVPEIILVQARDK